MIIEIGIAIVGVMLGISLIGLGRIILDVFC